MWEATISSFNLQPAAPWCAGHGARVGPAGAAHGAAGGQRNQGARSWHEREGVAAAPGGGADSRRPVGHGGTEEAARATATAWEVQPATRGWRGVAAEVPTSSGAARSRVAAIGSGEEEEGCET
jgi:hypothetical protein